VIVLLNAIKIHLYLSNYKILIKNEEKEMSYSTMLIPAVEVIITLILAIFIGLIIPGIERRYVQARIQQRIGPPVTSSGLWASVKFLYK
jgi:NADH:ubiquinone oxidoreductase subunit H